MSDLLCCKTLYISSMTFDHQLAPAFYMALYAISSKLHFTLHHNYAYCQKLESAPNSKSYVHPNIARLPPYVQLVGFCQSNLCPCSSPGSVYLQWIYLTLLWAGRKGPATYTRYWNAVITCTPVTIFFPLGVQLCSKLHPKRHSKNGSVRPCIVHHTIHW